MKMENETIAQAATSAHARHLAQPTHAPPDPRHQLLLNLLPQSAQAVGQPLRAGSGQGLRQSFQTRQPVRPAYGRLRAGQRSGAAAGGGQRGRHRQVPPPQDAAPEGQLAGGGHLRDHLLLLHEPHHGAAPEREPVGRGGRRPLLHPGRDGHGGGALPRQLQPRRRGGGHRGDDGVRQAKVRSPRSSLCRRST